MAMYSDDLEQQGAEIAVVGAGLIGLSVAYYLQLLGGRVTLIDKAFVGDNLPKVGLTRAFAYCKNTRPGALTDQGLVLAKCLINQMGYGGSLLDLQDEAFYVQPSSLLVPQPSTLPEFARDLAARCRDARVRVVEADPVHALLTDGNLVRGVDTATGRIYADEVVICAGFYSQELLAPIGLSLQLKEADNRLGASRVREGIPGVFVGRVPVTPSGEPHVGRPVDFRGLYLAIGHDTNPAAAIAVGQNVANALCQSPGSTLSFSNVEPQCGQSIPHPIC